MKKIKKCQACGIIIADEKQVEIKDKKIVEWYHYCQIVVEYKEKKLCDACAESWEFLDRVAVTLMGRQSTFKEFKKGEIDIEND